MLPNLSCQNTFDDFDSFCKGQKITLNEKQKEAAKILFSMPKASGKSLLIALLFAYDPSVQEYLRLVVGYDFGLHPYGGILKGTFVYKE